MNTATALGRAPKRSTTPRRGGLGTAICELGCGPFVCDASYYYFTYYYLELDHRHDTPGRICILWGGGSSGGLVCLLLELLWYVHLSASTRYFSTTAALHFWTVAFAKSHTCKWCRMQSPAKGTTHVFVESSRCTLLHLHCTFYSGWESGVMETWRSALPFPARRHGNGTLRQCCGMWGINKSVWTQTILAENGNSA